MAAQEKLRGKGFDRGVNVAEREQRQNQTEDAVLIAAHPVQVEMRSRLGHEQHDGRAAVERRYREQVERPQQQVKREHRSNQVLGKGVAVQPALAPSRSQGNRDSFAENLIGAM